MHSPCNHAVIAACRCGQVRLRIEAPPIGHVACYCESCQKAGQIIEELPDGMSVLGDDGGTDYLLFRKDQVRCTQGGERLKELRLKKDSPTRRLVAGCCNTGMYLDVTKGHWLTLYCGRVAGSVPPLQMRIMTAEGPEGVVIPNDVPAYPGRSGKLIWKLITAWVAMGLRIPAVKGAPKSGQADQISRAPV